MTPVMAIGDWRDNGELIRDVARLGHLDGHVVDLSFGQGVFWKTFKPESLTTNDIDPQCGADHHMNARSTQWDDGWFHAAVWDPPYRLRGTPTLGEMDKRYGTAQPATEWEILTLLCDGTREACRIASRRALVKCQDQVVSGRVVWQTRLVVDAAESVGWKLIDWFLPMLGGRPQPSGRSQVHARRNYSSLLVFAPKGRSKDA